MKKIRKRTPATLKRIIAEEKYKTKKEQKSVKPKRRKTLSENKKWETYIKLLKVLKEAKSKKNHDLEKIDQLRNMLKRKILRGL